VAEETTPPDKVIHLRFADGHCDPDDDPDHVRDENEEWYDEVVAPTLAKLGKECVDRGMSLMATVEYEPGGTGSSRFLHPDRGAKMQIVEMADRCRGNVDALIMGLYNYMERNDQIGVSIYMKLIQDWQSGKLKMTF